MRDLHSGVVDILLVEDNPGDIFLTTEMLRDSKIRNRVNVVMDGAEAMKYLHKEGKYAASETPDLVLLDLRLPKLNGHEVLARMKQDPALKCIPVIVLTSSDADEDVMRAYSNHANSYITKPSALDQYTNVLRSIEDFWMSVVRLPTRSGCA